MIETIYVEEVIKNHPRTKLILNKFRKSRIILINNYGEIVEYIPINKQGRLSGSAPINLDRSFYSRYGDISILMLLFLTLLSKGLIRQNK